MEIFVGIVTTVILRTATCKLGSEGRGKYGDWVGRSGKAHVLGVEDDGEPPDLCLTDGVSILSCCTFA